MTWGWINYVFSPQGYSIYTFLKTNESITSQEEVDILISSQVDRSQAEDVVSQASDEPDSPAGDAATSHFQASKHVQDT